MKQNRPDPHDFDPLPYRDILITILKQCETQYRKTGQIKLQSILNRHPKDGHEYFAKSELLKAYDRYAGTTGLAPYQPQLSLFFRKKPRRTLSGVTPITVLTKPYPCPGECIFCPNDVRMPKSYIASEPGAQRAAVNFFDPYLQTYKRLTALKDMGHPVDKAELLVLGGTWSIYPEPYQIWFIKRLFEALNDFGTSLDQTPTITPSITPVTLKPANSSYNQAITQIYRDQEEAKLKSHPETATWKELRQEHQRNETAAVRCVGLVLETRPDYVTSHEVIKLRRFGATKIQIGIQSLQDPVLAANKRGHTVTETRTAMALLRQAGFKIHAHWMPNLFGSAVEKDIADYKRLFADPAFRPDELKIYPCSLIDGTELVEKYRAGLWHPYTHAELLDVVGYCVSHTPRWCRLSRVVRDIPSPEIVAGNKATNFRELAEKAVVSGGGVLTDIRSREIAATAVTGKLKLKTTKYQTTGSTEYFLEYVTSDDRLAAFLRLSLSRKDAPGVDVGIVEIEDSALIREVHVYGQATPIGSAGDNVQHQGLGKNLILKSLALARSHHYPRVSVISAIGTRKYYRKLGFTDGILYQHFNLSAR